MSDVDIISRLASMETQTNYNSQRLEKLEKAIQGIFREVADISSNLKTFTVEITNTICHCEKKLEKIDDIAKKATYGKVMSTTCFSLILILITAIITLLTVQQAPNYMVNKLEKHINKEKIEYRRE